MSAWAVVWRREQRIDYWALAVLSFAIVLLNLIWVHTETRPPHWDMARHLYNSLQYWQNMVNGRIPRVLLSYEYYPPLLYWLTIPFYFIFGRSVLVAVTANDVVFLPILIFSTYLLGRQLWNRQTGLLAAVLTAAAPMIVTQFKEYQLDAAVTAMTTLSFWLLLKTDTFADRRWSVWLGLVAGLGLLTKWSLAIVIIGPALIIAVRAAVLDYRQRTWRRMANLAITLVVGYLVASSWYLTNLRQLLPDARQNSTQAGIAEGDPVIGTAASNWWYWRALLNVQLYALPSLLAVIGAAVTLVSSRARRRNLFPLIASLIAILAFTLIRNKDARYILPIIPCIAVIAVGWLSVAPKLLQRFVAAGIVLYCVITFVAISYGIGWLPKQVVVADANQPLTLWAQHGYIIGPPTHEKWYQQQAVAAVALQGDKSFRYSGPDTIWFNGWGLDYYRELYGLAPESATPTTPADCLIVRSVSASVLASGEIGKETQLSAVLPDGTRLGVYCK